MEVIMNPIIASNGVPVTDEMINKWEEVLESDQWPEGWQNYGEVIEGKLPNSMNDSVTLSVKIPAPLKHRIDDNAKSEGKSTSSYIRGLLIKSLML